MFFNNLKIALRNFSREKVFTILNLLGLSFGLACCVLLLLYIDNETSYDKHHENSENIYRVETVWPGATEESKMPTNSPPVAWGLKEAIPEIEKVTRVVNPPTVERNLFQYEDKNFYETQGYIVDSTFFQIFNFDFVEGNAITAFNRPNTVVIKEYIAQRLFGDEPATGEIIKIDNGQISEYEVSGVIADTQQESHVNANFYINMANPGWGQWINSQTSWATQNFIFTYAKVQPGTDHNLITDKVNNVIATKGAPHFEAAGFKKEAALMPVEDIHLYANYDLDLGGGGSFDQLMILGIIGLVILGIACINFINLSTAKAGRRAKEIGVRKTLGAQRSSLVTQFYAEVFLFVAFSALIAVILVDLSLPYFNYLSGKQLLIITLYSREILLAIVVLLGSTALIAGSYPSLLISSFKPAQALKQRLTRGGGNKSLRAGMVVFQFVISITLVGVLTIMFQQMEYMNNYEKGYTSEFRIVVPHRTDAAQENYEIFKDRISSAAGVKGFTATNYLPGEMVLNDFRIYQEGQTIKDGVLTKSNQVDDEYFDVLNIKIIAGRDFTAGDGTSDNVIINEKAAKDYGFIPQEIIGQPIYTDAFDGSEKLSFTVIGVVEDFHQSSLHFDVQPLLLHKNDEQSHNFAMIEIEEGKFDQVVEKLKDVWTQINTDTPLEYFELDAYERRLYEADQKQMQLIGISTGIAIILSCLGLFGLSLFTANQRRKELSIRKVFGATLQSLIQIQYKDFTKVIIISLIISVPLIYFGMEAWLENYTYRVDIGMMAFAISGMAAFIIGGATISYQAIKAALVNPTESLKAE